MSLLSQILGLDDYSKVTEVMLGVFLYLSRCEVGIKFDEFLAGEINSQLVNFHLVKHLRYQVYLFTLIVFSNRKSLESMDSKIFKEWPQPLQKIKEWSYILFIDRFVLSISRLFHSQVKRISEDMKDSLQ